MMKKEFDIEKGLLQGARWCPSPNFNARPCDISIDLLVIHNISLPPAQFENGYVEAFFQNKLPIHEHTYFNKIADLQVSAHLLITRAGEVVQFVNFNDRAWHAGKSLFFGRENCNDFSIGIEMEGTDDLAYTQSQYQSLVAVTLALQSEYPSIRKESIVGHEHIAPGRKTDPGGAFDWDNYFELLS